MEEFMESDSSILENSPSRSSGGRQIRLSFTGTFATTL